MEEINRKMEELLNSQDALIWKMRMALGNQDWLSMKQTN